MTAEPAGLVLREETGCDVQPIAALLAAAFGRPSEAALVGALREAGDLVLSLVAQRAGAVVGHVAFSRATISGPQGDTACLVLAPLAVAPPAQGAGIGTRLVRAALAEIAERGDLPGLVLVLGHAGYYPRFGFGPAAVRGIRCPFDVPDEAFMALDVREASTVTGTLRYAPAFTAL